MERGRDIYNKINEVLDINKIPKRLVAERLGITVQGFSYQLGALKSGKGINTKTLEVIEELTGFNFFSF